MSDDPKYLRQGITFNAAHSMEEAGELIQALGKLVRWGPFSTDPTSPLPPEQRETNIDYVRREFKDLQKALIRLEEAIENEMKL